MCKNCQNPDCPDIEDLLEQDEVPAVLVSRTKNADLVADMPDANYATFITFGAATSPLMGLLTSQFDSPADAAEALGITEEELARRLTDPDLTLAQYGEMLKAGGKELAGILVYSYGAERRRCIKQREEARVTSPFDAVFRTRMKRSVS